MTEENKDQVLDTETNNQAQDATNPDDTQDVDQGNAGESKVDKADFDKILSNNRKTNRENQGLKKRLAELEAKEKEREEAELTENEKLKKRVAEMEAEKAASDAALAHKDRMLVISSSGAHEQYQEYLAGELGKALDEDNNLDVKKWLAGIKKEAPAFFGNGNGSTAAASASGGPSTQSSNSAQIAALEEEKKKLIGAPGQKAAMRRMDIFKELQFLRSKNT